MPDTGGWAICVSGVTDVKYARLGFGCRARWRQGFGLSAAMVRGHSTHGMREAQRQQAGMGTGRHRGSCSAVWWTYQGYGVHRRCPFMCLCAAHRGMPRSVHSCQWCVRVCVTEDARVCCLPFALPALKSPTASFDSVEWVWVAGVLPSCHLLHDDQNFHAWLSSICSSSAGPCVAPKLLVRRFLKPPGNRQVFNGVQAFVHEGISVEAWLLRCIRRHSHSVRMQRRPHLQAKAIKHINCHRQLLQPPLLPGHQRSHSPAGRCHGGSGRRGPRA